MDCTVIVPIGPGHEQLAQVAIQSVILASDSPGPFDCIHVVVGDDTKGDKGRSATRNRMIAGLEEWMGIFSMGEDQEAAFTSDWLFFLDADDVMCTPKIFSTSAFEIVKPYVDQYDCIWGTIHELHDDGGVMRRKQVNRITTYSAYVRTPAPLSCQMGHFARRETFPGFNEELDVCEDVDLYLREWKNLRCIKQEQPLFLNRRGHHSWLQKAESEKPRHTGRDWSIQAEEMLKEARKAL